MNLNCLCKLKCGGYYLIEGTKVLNRQFIVEMRKVLDLYLLPKKIELTGRIYERLGIKTFLLFTPTEIRNKISGRKSKIIKNKTRLRFYYRDTILGEIAHLFSFLLLICIAMYFAFEGESLALVVISFANVLFNIYPIFLMRYNRIRIAKNVK